MKRIQGETGIMLMECISPAKNKWRARWDIKPCEDRPNEISYMEEEFLHKPSWTEIQTKVQEKRSEQYKERSDSLYMSHLKYKDQGQMEKAEKARNEWREEIAKIDSEYPYPNIEENDN